MRISNFGYDLNLYFSTDSAFSKRLSSLLMDITESVCDLELVPNESDLESDRDLIRTSRTPSFLLPERDSCKLATSDLNDRNRDIEFFLERGLFFKVIVQCS